MEILVLHPGALGDLILALPAIALLRSRFPQAVMTLAGNLDFLPALAPGYADRIVSLATVPLHALYVSDPPSEESRRFWQRYDRIVSWTGFGDPRFAANLERLCPEVLVAKWRPEPDDTRHVSRIFVDSLVPWLGPVDTIPFAAISTGPQYSCRAADWLSERGWSADDSILSIHPGAGGLAKRWPIERFIRLCSELIQKSGARIIFIEGPAEPGSARQIATGLADDRVVLIERREIQMLAAWLGRCRAFVGCDSGISHLAAATGIPSLVLFGPTNPDHWAPRGKAVEIVRDASGRLENLSPELVLHRLLQLISNLQLRTAGPETS